MKKALLVAALLAVAANAGERLINGHVVPEGERPHVVNIVTGNSGCTAAVVGPRVLTTASHCGQTGATTRFQVAGKSYSGKFQRSPLYPKRDHDVALVVVSKDVVMPEGKTYLSIGEVIEEYDRIDINGYGCTKPGGGGSDGKLRHGIATVTGFSGYDAVTGNGNKEAAVCFGDSGGPGTKEGRDGKPRQVTSTSKGDIKKKSYLARWDIPESRKFLEDQIQKKGLKICGVNIDCD